MPSNSEREAADNGFRNLDETLKELRAAATAPSAPAESWLKKTFNPAAPSSHQSEFNVALVDALDRLATALHETAASQEARFEQLEKELLELRTLPENIDAFREHSIRMESELRSVAANVRGLQERAAAMETELAQAREEQSREMQRIASEQNEKIDRLASEQNEKLGRLANEQNEKIDRISSEQSEKINRVSSQQTEKIDHLASEHSDKIQRLAGEQRDLGRDIAERIQHLLDEQRVCIRQLTWQASEEAVLADRARRATELKLEELARRVPQPPA